MNLHIRLTGGLRMLGWLLLAAAPCATFAADPAAPGKVRITDRKAPAAQQKIQPTGFQDVVYDAGDWYDESSNCFGDGGYGGYGGHKWRKWCCLNSPPYGRPIVAPYPGRSLYALQATAPYQRYWSDAWLGHPGPVVGPHFHPMVYQPTDTTQLGFYYTRVPSWSYRPGILPAAPQPNWVVGDRWRVKGGKWGHGGWGGGYGNGFGGNGPNGDCYGEETVINGAPVIAPAPAGTPAPIPDNQVPPEPAPEAQNVPRRLN